MYIGNKYSEKVEHLKYWVTSLIDQNSLYEKINCTLQSGNVCFHLVQYFLAFILCGCETWSTAVKVLQEYGAKGDIWAYEG
jgi:histone deacetylase complex regulatory component SIN3